MYDKIISDLLKNGAKKATYFISKDEIIRVARTTYHFYKTKFPKNGNIELTITRGKPNYAERELAKKLKEEIKGMTFFKYLPKKKVASKKKK